MIIKRRGPIQSYIGGGESLVLRPGGVSQITSEKKKGWEK